MAIVAATCRRPAPALVVVLGAAVAKVTWVGLLVDRLTRPDVRPAAAGGALVIGLLAATTLALGRRDPHRRSAVRAERAERRRRDREAAA